MAVLTACSEPSTPTETTTSVAAASSVTAQSNSGQTAEEDPIEATGTNANTETTETTETTVTYKENDYYTDWNTENPVFIELTGSGASINGTGAEANDGSVVITAEGTYVLSGKLTDGQIVVDVQKDEKVRLVLNGVELHNSDNAAIYINESDKTVISLQEGTDNTISDGDAYVYEDATADEPNAAVFSNGDLTINGTGKLTVLGNYNNGITSKDDLKITGGTIDIQSADDGLMGRDLVAVQDGEITIEAGGDGIKSTNDTDASKGLIAIEGGTFNINAGSDGIQAASTLVIDGGTYTIVSGGGSVNGEVRTGENMRGPWNNRTVETSNQSGDTDEGSAKGLKAAGDIQINKGTFNIDAADDAIHSNTNITITGGDFAVTSGDDGVHADVSVKIAGGTIDIAKSYEGIEGAAVTIDGGETRIVSSDDGINIAGSNDRSSSKLTINGGQLSIDATGDGLDSNGSISMTGGIVIVNGPAANMNGALDYDGTFDMSGGFLIAAGSAGMAQAPSENSSQNAVIMFYSQTQQAGTLVHLEDSEGNEIATFAPTKNYQVIVVSSPNLKEGTTYTLYSGGTANGSEQSGLYNNGEYRGGNKVVEFEIANSVTWLSETGVTAARSGGFGGMGGGRNRPEGTTPPVR
ncbi:carbohydrate-binding domain-containing protein [Paenibacillus tarimensis]